MGNHRKIISWPTTHLNPNYTLCPCEPQTLTLNCVSVRVKVQGHMYEGLTPSVLLLIWLTRGHTSPFGPPYYPLD